MRISDWSSDVCSSDLVKGYETSLDWLDRCGHMLTNRARRGYRATVLAYHMAPIRPVAAIKDLAVGMVAGGVPPRVIARQVPRSSLPKPLSPSLVHGLVLRFGKHYPSTKCDWKRVVEGMGGSGR